MANVFDRAEVSLREAASVGRADGGAPLSAGAPAGVPAVRGARAAARGGVAGHWLTRAGWQSGAFKCAPRDRWLGWHRSVQFRRLHLIGNNTRFLILPEAAGMGNLASRTLGLSLRPLRSDAAARLADPVDRAEWSCRATPVRYAGAELRSLHCARCATCSRMRTSTS